MVAVVPDNDIAPVTVQLSAKVYVIEVPENVNVRDHVTPPEVNVVVPIKLMPLAPACVYPPVPKLTNPLVFIGLLKVIVPT